MRLLTLAIAAVLAAGRVTPPPQDAELDKDKAAIVQATLDYAEGYYGGEPARMARAVSPFLSKRSLTVRPGVPPFRVEMNADTLIDAANGAKLAAADRHITTEVLDVTGDVASARVFTAQFNDFLHLVRRHGAWQILNVLWHAPMPTGGAADASPPGALDEARIAVLGIDVDIASAKLTAGPSITYLHLALTEGKWRVVNTLAYSK